MIPHELWLELSLQAWLNTCCQVDLPRLANSFYRQERKKKKTKTKPRTTYILGNNRNKQAWSDSMFLFSMAFLLFRWDWSLIASKSVPGSQQIYYWGISGITVLHSLYPFFIIFRKIKKNKYYAYWMFFLPVLRDSFTELQQVSVVGFPFPEAVLSNCFQYTAVILFCTMDATVLQGKEFEFANSFTWEKRMDES